MPFNLLGPLISGGTALLGGVLNSNSQEKQNEASMRFAREMYDRQKTDNLALWNLQNQYNTPEAQMSRFKAAGLNPNLIYGQGNAGNASQLSTPDVQHPEFRSPEWGNGVSAAGLGFVNGIYDLEIKAAQADNLRAQNSVIQQDALLRAAQIANTTAGTERSRFDLGLDSELRNVSAEARRESLRQLKVGIDLSQRRDARETVMNATNVQEAFARMANLKVQELNSKVSRVHTAADTQRIKQEITNMKSQLNNLRKDGTLKQLDVNLKKDGIQPHDPMWARTLHTLWQRWFGE